MCLLNPFKFWRNFTFTVIGSLLPCSETQGQSTQALAEDVLQCLKSPSPCQCLGAVVVPTYTFSLLRRSHSQEVSSHLYRWIPGDPTLPALQTDLNTPRLSTTLALLKARPVTFVVTYIYLSAQLTKLFTLPEVCALSRSVVSDSLWPHKLPGSSVHGILQARILEWVTMPPPGDLPDPGIKPRSPSLQVNSLLSEPPGKPSWCVQMPCEHIYLYSIQI